MREPAASNRRAVRAFGYAPVFGPTWTENARSRCESFDAALYADAQADPSRYDEEPSGCGLPQMGVRRYAGFRSAMVRIAPRLGPAAWHLDVIRSAISVTEKAPSDLLPRNHPATLSWSVRTPANSCTDCARGPSARGAPPSPGLGSAVGGARERCGPAITASLRALARPGGRRAGAFHLPQTVPTRRTGRPNRAARVVHSRNEASRRPRRDPAPRGRCRRSRFSEGTTAGGASHLESDRVSLRHRSEDSALAGGDAPPLWPSEEIS